MVIGHPLLINWEIHPSTSVRTEISLVSWIDSSETDPKAGVELLTGCAPAKTPIWSNQGGPLEAFDLQDGIPLGLWVGQVQKWDSCLAKLTYWTPIRLVQGVPVSITQLSILESAGHRVSSVVPGVITALAPTLDRSLKSDRSLCPFKHCATIWTGPQTSGRIRRWFLSPLRKVSTKTSHLPLSPLGSSRLWSYVMSSLTRSPTFNIRLKPMMSGPWLLLRSSSWVSP